MKLAPTIKKKLDEKRADAASKWQAFSEERDKLAKDGKDLSEDRDSFESLHEKHREYAQIADEVKQLETDLISALAMDGDGPETGKADDDPDAKPASKADEIWTPGQRLVQADAYKSIVESGELMKASKGDFRMPAIEVANREEFKALLTGLSRTSAGAFLTPDRQPGLYGLLTRPLVVRDLVTIGDTDTDIVEWVKETTFTNAAAETAEATATGDGSGAKPESALAYAVVQSNVRTIAHWIPATKRALSDAGQIRTLIDSRLQDGVNLRLDSQMINGDGAGENLRGILNTTGILSQARGADPAVEAILKGITLNRLQFLEPTGILMHPTDAMNARLAKNANGDYYFGPPNIAGALQIWGIPIAQSAVIAQGTALVGKWNEAVLWVREGISVSASDSHQDFFTRNMVAVLAEGRFAFAVPRPYAFTQVTGL